SLTFVRRNPWGSLPTSAPAGAERRFSSGVRVTARSKPARGVGPTDVAKIQPSRVTASQSPRASPPATCAPRARRARRLPPASWLTVRRPAGQIGNSEVGHLNPGAGRVVPQDIVRISQAIQSGEFFRLPALVELCRGVKRRGATLHLMGLLGNGGVHALDQHLVAAIMLGHQHELPVAIHAWLDGRDTPPQSGLGFMQELLDGIGARDPAPGPPAPVVS